MTHDPSNLPVPVRALERLMHQAPLVAWGPDAADLPWGDPAFSERMLREHLDQRHDLASRRESVIADQVDRLVEWLGLRAGDSLLDLTCGPGLVARAFARRGIEVTGVDIAPAAIRHASTITDGLPCTFIEGDVRDVELPLNVFDAAVYLYGQMAVARPDDVARILDRVRRSLRAGAPLALEVRDPATVDRSSSRSWWTGTDDLWGDGSHVLLQEQAWDADARATVERYHVIDVATGSVTVLGVTERALEVDDVRAATIAAGFPSADIHPAWGGLAFDGAADWNVVIAR